MHNTQNRQTPPKGPKAPRHQPRPLTNMSDGPGRVRSEERATIIRRKGALQDRLSEDLQRESALSERPADNHVLVDLLRDGVRAIEVLEKHDGGEGES